MNENYKIMSKYIKDISGETPDIETYLYVKDYISKYQLNIDINSKPLKDKIIEVNTLLKFHDNSESKKKSHFEITYSTVIKLNKEIKDKNISLEERITYQNKLNDRPRNGSSIRHRNRCEITGRPRGNYRKFGLSRIKLRELSMTGNLPGVVKSSW